MPRLKLHKTATYRLGIDTIIANVLVDVVFVIVIKTVNCDPRHVGDNVFERCCFTDLVIFESRITHLTKWAFNELGVHIVDSVDM